MNKDLHARSTVIDLFESIVADYPENIALIYENTKITYKELNNLSNKMAVLIQNRYQMIINDNQKNMSGITVAICISRNIEMMITILGVLKTGAAYVIINPDLPSQGIRNVLDNSDSSILVECNSTIDPNKLKELEAEKKYKIIRDSMSFLLDEHKEIMLHIEKLKPADLAYIVYTSGTTGVPKGVRMTHESLAFFCTSYANKMAISPGTIVDYVLSPVFTGSIPCFFPPLIAGGTLLIQPANILLNPHQYALEIQKHSADILKFTPAIFNLLSPYLSILSTKHLKIVLAGESLLTNQIKPYLVNDNWEIYNQYGFAECVAGFCSYKINPSELNSESVPVGVPYPGREKLLMDENLNPVCDGEVGELLVGGLGLAEGYQKLSEETQRKFINISGQRYYRTGDLARINLQGNIEILQRNDNQIKINGIRIEISEIENKVLELSGIKSGLVVLIKADGFNDEVLVVYFSCLNKGLVRGDQIKNHLEIYLAPYMIPQFYIEVVEFPVNENGKIDRRKLLSEYPMLITKNPHLSVRGDLQLKLQTIWSEVLATSLENIGSTSDFFLLGGNSLKAYQVLIRMNEIYHANFSVKNIFTCRTIEAQEEFILKNSEFSEQIHMQYINEEF